MTTVRRKLSSELMILLIKDKKLSKCCEDPVIHERITKDLKDWINVKAPGAKDTKGCSKKFHFPNFQSEKGKLKIY